MRRHSESIIAHVAVHNAMRELALLVNTKWAKDSDKWHPKLLFVTDMPDAEATKLIQSGSLSVAIVRPDDLANAVFNSLHDKAGA